MCQTEVMDELLQNLLPEDLREIEETDKDYVFFDVNATNAGMAVSLEFTDSFEDFQDFVGVDWNGIDVLERVEVVQDFYMPQKF